MVFKKDVLVSAATMTRKEGRQKSGGIRDRKQSNGVESKKKRKKKGLHSQIFPIIASRNRERLNVTYLREWKKKVSQRNSNARLAGSLLYLGTAQSLFN